MRIPNETIIDIQSRLVTAIDIVRRRSAEPRIALVSQGDPLRAALCFYLGMPLDLIPRLHITPASVSVLEIDDWAVRISSLNWRA